MYSCASFTFLQNNESHAVKCLTYSLSGLFHNLKMTHPAQILLMLFRLCLVFVSAWGHAAVYSEVKQADEIDAVIGHVAPMGVAAPEDRLSTKQFSTDIGRSPTKWFKGHLSTREDMRVAVVHVYVY